ncbi:MAG: GTP cyclohydrolase I FolE [Candidatus Promineofilum sp.]|nr:GTP cyclohydrolase I FolE [Promineifilum sp.]
MYNANQLNGQLNGNASPWPVELDTALLVRGNGATNGHNHNHGFALLPALPTAADRNLSIQQAVRDILVNVGEDPDRDGLLRTPHRVAKMWGEVLSGYDVDPVALVNGALFDVEYDEMVVVKEIEFHSMCEHHMLPFFGRAHVAYLPGEKIIGLSKIPRIVDMFARRLQVQERMTNEIAAMLETVLQPRGVAVVIEGSHMCGIMRGVEKEHPRMVTTAMRGEFKHDRQRRDEFMEHLRRPGGSLQ